MAHCGHYFCTVDKATSGQIKLLLELYDLKMDLLFKQNKTRNEWQLANDVCNVIQCIEYKITNRSYSDVVPLLPEN